MTQEVDAKERDEKMTEGMLKKRVTLFIYFVEIFFVTRQYMRFSWR